MKIINFFVVIFICLNACARDGGSPNGLDVISVYACSKLKEKRVNAGYFLSQSWLGLSHDEDALNKGFSILIKLLGDSDAEVRDEAVSSALSFIMLIREGEIKAVVLDKGRERKLEGALRAACQDETSASSKRVAAVLKQLIELRGN